MPRHTTSDLPGGVTPPAGFRDQSLSGGRWVQDDSKPGDGAGPAAPTGPRVTLETPAKDGSRGDLDVQDGREGGGGPVPPSIVVETSGSMTGPAAPAIAAAEAAPTGETAELGVPDRVCGPMDGSTGNPSLDKILAEFEGMSRWEVRQEMRDWDRADLREFRQEFREEFGVGFAHADWLWG